MSLQTVIRNKFIGLFSLIRNSHPLWVGCFLISIFICEFSKAESNDANIEVKNQPNLDYINSRNSLEDYIIDSGDELYIEFYPTEEFNNNYQVSAEGEVLLPRLYETFVRGLTTSELEKLLEKRYLEYLIEPDIKVSISQFKSLRVLIRGEVRYPGLYKFPSYRSGLFLNIQKNEEDSFDQYNSNTISIDTNIKPAKPVKVKRTSKNITTISDVIRKAGGITSLTDLSKIEVIRDVPLGKGGGKKRAYIDLNSLVYESDDSNDLRIFDGDSIFVPKLSQTSKKQIPKSILSGLSPKFISVDISGRIENPGPINLPLEATLSDAIDLTGPIKPFSGKIVLIRYNKDGSVEKKKISYSSRAKRGSRRNPYVKPGDLISVQNGFLGQTSGVLKEITEPFIGIYATKELYESFGE